MVLVLILKIYVTDVIQFKICFFKCFSNCTFNKSCDERPCGSKKDLIYLFIDSCELHAIRILNFILMVIRCAKETNKYVASRKSSVSGVSVQLCRKEKHLLGASFC
jgi:hypothetical protein